ALVTAIIRHENGQQPYSAEQIAQAIGKACGTDCHEGQNHDTGQQVAEIEAYPEPSVGRVFTADRE
ncbi:hypothetical protein ACV343_32495, partial [Pseudomonas aeruginosa]